MPPSPTPSTPRITCQCGAISLHAPRPAPSAVFICHCLECRAQSASAFGVSAIFPASPPLWPLPESHRRLLGVWTRPTDAGNTLECYFCKTCGVRVLHRGFLADGTPRPTVSVKGGCLEGLSLEGARHIFVRSALVAVPEGSDQGEPKEEPSVTTD